MGVGKSVFDTQVWMRNVSSLRDFESLLSVLPALKALGLSWFAPSGLGSSWLDGLPGVGRDPAFLRERLQRDGYARRSGWPAVN